MRTSTEQVPLAGAFSTKPQPGATPPSLLTPAARRVVSAHDNAARNDAAFDTAGELDAWSRHAVAANGFGATELTDQARVARDAGMAAAGHAASASLVQILGVMVEALADQFRLHVRAPLVAALARRHRRRAIARTAATLSQLDPRTLRDIGLSASDAASVAAEAYGQVERTRQRLLSDLHLYGR